MNQTKNFFFTMYGQSDRNKPTVNIYVFKNSKNLQLMFFNYVFRYLGFGRQIRWRISR